MLAQNEGIPEKNSDTTDEPFFRIASNAESIASNTYKLAKLKITDNVKVTIKNQKECSTILS